MGRIIFWGGLGLVLVAAAWLFARLIGWGMRRHPVAFAIAVVILLATCAK